MLAGTLCLSSWAALAPPAATAAPAARSAPSVVVDPGTYPYPNAGTSQLDAWGFTARQCTSYAAWWLNAHGLNLTRYTHGPGGSAHFGNASGWGAAAQQAGWLISRVPEVGAIAQWDANETSTWTTNASAGSFTAGALGHVAVVTAVDPTSGLATLNSYNADDDSNYSVFQGVAPRYLLIGFATTTTAVTAPVMTTPPTSVSVSSRRTRSVGGVVSVYDSSGAQIGVDRLPVVASHGRTHAKVAALKGGGFRTLLSTPGAWLLTTKVRGYRCGSATIRMTSSKPAFVQLTCVASLDS